MRQAICHRCPHRRYSHKIDSAGRCRRGWALDKDGDWYQLGEPGEACECPGWEDVPAELRKRGQRAVRAGRKAEQRVAVVTGERARGGPGNADNGCQETKVMTKQIRGHIDEALRHGGDAVRYVYAQQVWELRRIA